MVLGEAEPGRAGQWGKGLRASRKPSPPLAVLHAPSPPSPMPLARVPGQPQLGNASKGALCTTLFCLASGHNEAPVAGLGASALCPPCVSRLMAPLPRASSLCMVRAVLQRGGVGTKADARRESPGPGAVPSTAGKVVPEPCSAPRQAL